MREAAWTQFYKVSFVLQNTPNNTRFKLPYELTATCRKIRAELTTDVTIGTGTGLKIDFQTSAGGDVGDGGSDLGLWFTQQTLNITAAGSQISTAFRKDLDTIEAFFAALWGFTSIGTATGTITITFMCQEF